MPDQYRVCLYLVLNIASVSFTLSLTEARVLAPLEFSLFDAGTGRLKADRRSRPSPEYRREYRLAASIRRAAWIQTR